MKNFSVTVYDPSGVCKGAVSGMGRNRGTWDGTHSRRTAMRHARRLSCEDKFTNHTIRVEDNTRDVVAAYHNGAKLSGARA